jgi:CheY-like chemotaxis protein/Sec-independent protein translocase protein TatA
MVMDPPRVLLVEDNADAAFALHSLLRLSGYEVRVAYDGVHALEVLDTFAPDCVISDIHMPRMDGYRLAESIRGRSDHKAVVLIALSSADDRQRTKAAGFDHHLVKPADSFVLDRLLKDALKMDERLKRAENIIQSQGAVVDEVRELVKDVKSDVREVKSDVKEMKHELKQVNEEIKELKEDLNELKEDSPRID